MTRVACIGEAMIELSIKGNLAQLGVAGDALNTAVYLKREAPDIEVDFITALGDDPFSDRVADFIREQDVGTGKIPRIAGKSPGLYAITTNPAGERSFTYWRSASAAREMFNAGSGLSFDALKDYDLIYLSGISVAILPPDARHALLQWLSDHAVRLAYDSNYRPRLWESVETARKMTSQFWERADISLPSIDDEMALFGETAEQTVARFEQTAARGAIKRGPDGPVSLGQVVAQDYPAAQEVVDTTAAGDSFNGGYLAAILSGKTQSEALLAGHICAARVVRYRGAIIPKEAL